MFSSSTCRNIFNEMDRLIKQRDLAWTFESNPERSVHLGIETDKIFRDMSKVFERAEKNSCYVNFKSLEFRTHSANAQDFRNYEFSKLILKK